MTIFDVLREKLHKEDLEFMQQSDLMSCIDSVINQVEQEYNKFSSETGFISRTEVLKLIEDIKCNMDIPKNYGTLLDIMSAIRSMPSLDNNGWIPCSERLPEESGYYMGCIYNSEVDEFDFRKIWFAHADDYDMEESEWRELYGFETVTAWQPLPEPYEEKENE